jgi:hypothetical protein
MKGCLDQFMSEGYKFLLSVDTFYEHAPSQLQKKSYEVILQLIRYNGKYVRYPQPDLMARGSRLLAKVAKKDTKFAARLSHIYGLNCNMAKTGEQELAKLILNLNFKNMSCCPDKH